jgi:hypothetical protein
MLAIEFTGPLNRKKRSKLVVFLFAPILAIVFMVGWSLYWVGQANLPKMRQLQKPINKALTNQKEIELIVIPQEQQRLAS